MQADAEVLNAIPHRPPFLYVDKIIERAPDGVVCQKTFEPDEYFFAGHYPDFPLVPGVILCEAAMQAGAVFLAELIRKEERDSTDGAQSIDNSPKIPVATRVNDVKFRKIVRPGETIKIAVALKEKMANAYFFLANITVDGKTAARLEFACALQSTNGA